MQIHDSIVIHSPISKVFQVFADLGSAENSLSAVSKIEILHGGSSMQIGSRWRETRTMFGQTATEEMEVSKFEQNKMYEVVAESSGAIYRTVFEFADLGNDQTEVKMMFEGIPTTFMGKLLTPIGYLFLGATKKALHQDLEDLKKVSEA